MWFLALSPYHGAGGWRIIRACGIRQALFNVIIVVSVAVALLTTIRVHMDIMKSTFL